ncbi:MAG: helix-turn-helix transcriptional regulator [Actinobacteria bacterium]|nr:helix-turn-helix transcriptional regulator [Actinomycetota bacterium]
MSDAAPEEVVRETARRVGEAIRRAREERGWRQEDLADAAGFELKQTKLSKWERGMLRPSIAELVWLEQCLDLKPGMLFAAADLVPPSLDTMNAISHDPELDDEGRRTLQHAYWAIVLASRSQREGGRDAGGRRRRRRES